ILDRLGAIVRKTDTEMAAYHLLLSRSRNAFLLAPRLSIVDANRHLTGAVHRSPVLFVNPRVLQYARLGNPAGQDLLPKERDTANRAGGKREGREGRRSDLGATEHCLAFLSTLVMGRCRRTSRPCRMRCTAAQ